jgi:hypothetical protein
LDLTVPKCSMEDFKPILRREFNAEEGSFLLQLRCSLVWDKAAFSRLVQAMEKCAVANKGAKKIDRWIAEGFWYLETFVPEWSSHPNFPRPHGDEYYDAAYQRLRDLSYWLFVGESVYEGGGPLKPL